MLVVRFPAVTCLHPRDCCTLCSPDVPLQYGDGFDIMGNKDRALNTNARLRYHFGWLGADDIAVVQTRGSHALAALGDTDAGAPRAAVIPTLELWLEWRSGVDSPSGLNPDSMQANPGPCGVSSAR